jgi:hypothetical protein
MTRGIFRLHHQVTVSFMLFSCLAYSSTLKMETIYSSETWLDFHYITQSYITKYKIGDIDWIKLRNVEFLNKYSLLTHTWS